MNNEERKLIEPKQVIVIRKDLNMPSGKLGAQIAHASEKAIFDMFKSKTTNNKTVLTLELDDNNKKDLAIKLWLSNRFTKVIVYVKSEEKLKEVYQKALNKNLPCSLIQDAGFTFFQEPTYTTVGIGPCFPEDFIGITDKLQLFKD